MALGVVWRGAGRGGHGGYGGGGVQWRGGRGGGFCCAQWIRRCAVTTALPLVVPWLRTAHAEVVLAELVDKAARRGHLLQHKWLEHVHERFLW